MYKSELKHGRDEYTLWVRIVTENKNGFPESVSERVERVRRNPKTRHLVKKATESELYVSTALYWHIQSDVATVPMTTVTLYAEPASGGKPRALRKNVKTYGKDMSDYDELLRMLAY